MDENEVIFKRILDDDVRQASMDLQVSRAC